MSLSDAPEGLAKLRSLRIVRMSAAEVPDVRLLLDETLEVQYDSVFYHQLQHSPRVFGFIAIVPAAEAGFTPKPVRAKLRQAVTRQQREWVVVGAITAKCELSVTQISRSSSGVPKIYLTSLAVHPAWRRLHVGTELLRRTLDYIREEAAAAGVNVDLHTLTTNEPAIHLYEKFGFIIRQRIPGFYYFQGARHDAVCMRVHVLPKRRAAHPLGSPPRPDKHIVPDANDPRIKSASRTTSTLASRARRAALPANVETARRLLLGSEGESPQDQPGFQTAQGGPSGAGSRRGHSRAGSSSSPPSPADVSWMPRSTFCEACCMCLQACLSAMGLADPPLAHRHRRRSDSSPGGEGRGSEGSPLLRESHSGVPLVREGSMDSTTTRADVEGRMGELQHVQAGEGVVMRPVSMPVLGMSGSGTGVSPDHEV